MATSPLRVGIVGCGHIVEQYLQTLPRLPDVRFVAAADLDPARAQAVAARVDGARALPVDELLADPDVDVVLNLTIPAAHDRIALAALAAGKHVHGEKPLAATTRGARAVLDAAAEAGLVASCAPDTVLGTGTQTARVAIDGGVIGRPVAATAVMVTPGHERWHPNPEFYYQHGGGPLFDMGPYYVSALVTLLGPVVSVVGAASSLRDQR
ncbi:Gfo/Idh/MocA family protein, partial [Microbacterium sp.]|uniref:Gfo/Idh/MocA family protein n=1 Tax=Microbacterium sp. TaxID=51671 RepID=UPI0035C82C66